MHGWCYRPGAKFAGMRLVLPDRVLPGHYGFSRPDVRARYPEAPDDFTGFEIRGILPVGTHEVEFQFLDAQGGWHTLHRAKMSARKSRPPLWSRRGNSRDLIEFQLTAGISTAPRPLSVERFPSTRSNPTRWPRFSIVTPSYNQGGFLGETMESVLSQPDVTIEYVIQDGGSTDGSVDLIKRRALQLASWESAPDQGQADAIAKGFSRTKGNPDDLMAWLNSDDCYMPGALRFVADYFARHPDVDVVYGNRVVIDDQSREVGRWYLPAHDNAVLRLNDFVPQESLFWRRSLWDRVGGIDSKFHFAMDWDLLLRFQQAGAKIVHLPYFLACFRTHPAQKTSAKIETIGRKEIDLLRTRSTGRQMTVVEVADHPTLLAYLRKSAWRELWGRMGIRLS